MLKVKNKKKTKKKTKNREDSNDERKNKIKWQMTSEWHYHTFIDRHDERERKYKK
jgi:hypothetical protein